MSMAGLMKGLEALRAAPQSPVLGSSKHSDVILRSTDYNGHAGTFKNGYLRVGTWNYKAGASDPGGQVTKATMSGMFESCLTRVRCTRIRSIPRRCTPPTLGP